MKARTLATSGSAEGIGELVAKFYATTPDRIALTEHAIARDGWAVFEVKVGEKVMKGTRVERKAGRWFFVEVKP